MAKVENSYVNMAADLTDVTAAGAQAADGVVTQEENMSEETTSATVTPLTSETTTTSGETEITAEKVQTAAQKTKDQQGMYDAYNGKGGDADGFYTQVEQFQAAYDRDSYASTAEKLGYTKLERSGGVYDVAQSLVAFTGNIDSFIDTIQAKYQLPDFANNILDTIQGASGSIRENFYELLEAQQQYGFGKGFRVWFDAKANPAKAIVESTQKNVYDVDVENGKKLAEEGKTFDSQTSANDVLIGAMDNQNVTTADWAVQGLGDAVFESSWGGKANLVNITYGGNSAEASNERREMLANLDNLVAYWKQDNGTGFGEGKVWGAAAIGWEYASAGTYAIGDMVDSMVHGKGLFGNIEESSQAEVATLDAQQKANSKLKILQMATERGISVAEAQNIYAQAAFGNDGTGAASSLYNTYASEEDSLKTKIRKTSDALFGCNANYSEKDGLYTDTLSKRDRAEYAVYLFGPYGVMNDTVETLMQQSGCSREDVIRSMDKNIYGLNIDFTEEGQMYVMTPEEALAKKYPGVEEIIDTTNFTDKDGNYTWDSVAAGAYAWLTTSKDDVEKKLREFGVAEEDIQKYMTNAYDLDADEVDMNLDRVGTYTKQKQQQNALTADMQNGGCDAAKFAQQNAMAAQTNASQATQKASSVASAAYAGMAAGIPDKVTEDYSTDNSDQMQYGS